MARCGGRSVRCPTFKRDRLYRKVVRRATDRGSRRVARAPRARGARGGDAASGWRARARSPMKIVDVEIEASRRRVTVFFNSEERVDFRDLVRDLAREFHARIEMRQIGARDTTKLIDGIGPCGRQLCCSSHLRKFDPISVKMAKAQDMPLTDSRLLGNCGRLKCCLLYEFSTYEELRSRLPRVNTACSADCGGQRLHDRQGPVAPRPQAVGGRRLPGRHRGGSPARPAHLGRARSHQAGLTAGPTRRMSTFYLTTPIYYVNARAASRARVRPPSWPTPCAATAAWPATASISSPAPTSTATRSRRRRPRPGVSPQAYADEIAAAFRETWRRLGITNDDFIRTTEPRHRKVVQEILQRSARLGRDLLRRVRRLVLLRLRALLHREGDRGRQVPRSPDRAHLHQGEELLLPDVEVPGLADQAPGGAPGLHPARSVPERGARLPARAARRTCRSAGRARGSSGASRCPSTTST